MLFRSKESNQDERFYSDQVEHLEHIEIKRVSKNTALNKKKWRRDFKLFAKEMDMQVKYRKGYKLLLEVFKLKGVTLMDAQTPRERGSVIKDKVQIEIETETR